MRVETTARMTCWLALVAYARLASAGGELPSITDFARGPLIVEATISPDARYLAWITTVQDARVLVVQDRSVTDSRPQAIMRSDPARGLYLRWCGFVSAARLLCGVGGTGKNPNGSVYELTRLIAVDANGKHIRELVQDQGAAAFSGQFQDRIVDWTSGEADTVLIAAQANTLNAVERTLVAVDGGSMGRTMDEYPSVFALNTATGGMVLRYAARPPLRSFISDHQGHVRLGWGNAPNSDQIKYDVHDDSGGWRTLLTFKETDEGVLRPIALCPGDRNCAFAFGSYQGREALWHMDLTGKSPPQIEFSHPQVDVHSAVFDRDGGQLIGVRYDTDRPFLYYVDPKKEAVVRAVQSVLPDAYIVILDFPRDESLYLLRASSDVDAGTYLLYDVHTGALTKLGTSYPQLARTTLGRMQTLSYPAQDGTRIPGYLTAPPGTRPEHLPLIVMPHGGPRSRDYWYFDFLRLFLVSRGYAVLQMEFRGSSGYGDDWFYAARQDWGGLTYSDIVDGARWAVKEGIADPRRMCIVGWSFGGYAALLGAARNGDLFRCAVSIAGISDLSLLQREFNSPITRERLGTDPEKLKADSPVRHASEVSVPLLMFHGDRDPRAPIEQSRAMDAALTAAHKDHTFVEFAGADHDILRESDRVMLLTAIEKFLAEHLGLGVRPPVSEPPVARGEGDVCCRNY